MEVFKSLTADQRWAGNRLNAVCGVGVFFVIVVFFGWGGIV